MFEDSNIRKIDIDIPDSRKGEYRIETFEVTERDATLSILRSLLNKQRKPRPVYPGIYKRLLRGGVIVMSNTPAEIFDHREPLKVAKEEGGNFLIAGLGLGVVLKGILESDKVESVIVIEKSKDVIDLVAPYYPDKRVTIINEDIFSYIPEENIRFSYIWFDIWDNICRDNLKEIRVLFNKFRSVTDNNKKGAWGLEDILYEKKNTSY